MGILPEEWAAVINTQGGRPVNPSLVGHQPHFSTSLYLQERAVYTSLLPSSLPRPRSVLGRRRRSTPCCSFLSKGRRFSRRSSSIRRGASRGWGCLTTREIQRMMASLTRALHERGVDKYVSHLKSALVSFNQGSEEVSSSGLFMQWQWHYYKKVIINDYYKR